jgi:hypothetical protein
VNPDRLSGAASIVRQYDRVRSRTIAGWKLQRLLEAGEDPTAAIQQFQEQESTWSKRGRRIVRGVNSYPTETPPEDILLGKGWLRIGDIATMISTAGAGKSVAITQAAMAWGLGLPYFGICPARPLRILLFSGEDDGVTLGQCREGFLEHSKAITGRQLSAADFEPLDEMLRTDFSREHVGSSFHNHLSGLLTEAPADLVLINPLLSYIGGEIVSCASEWLRAGLMPILQKHKCAAIIAHHTGKMSKDGWDNTDDTYSAIGGGEIANIPRSILTLRPAGADGIFVVKVSKRQTTGWKDTSDNFSTSYFLRRSSDPERPAWIPVAYEEAYELVAKGRSARTTGKPACKVSPEDIIAALQVGPTQRTALIDRIMRNRKCSDRTASTAILLAEADNWISSFEEPNPNGGKPIKWLRLPEHSNEEET